VNLYLFFQFLLEKIGRFVFVATVQRRKYGETKEKTDFHTGFRYPLALIRKKASTKVSGALKGKSNIEPI